MNRPALALALLFAASPLLAAGAAAPAKTAPPSAPRAAAAPAPSNAAAVVGELQGSVEVLLDGVEPWVPAAVGMQLTADTKVRTSGGSATLQFFDGSKVRLSGKSQFTIEAAHPSKIAVFLNFGKLDAWVAKLKGRSFQTRTPSAVASVRGTVFTVNCPDGKATQIDLFQGSLAVNDSFGRSLMMSSGQRVEALPAPPAGKTTAPPPAPKAEALPPAIQMPPEPKLAVAMPPMPGNAPPAGQVPPQQQMANMPPAGQLPLLDPNAMMNNMVPPPNPLQNTTVTCPMTVSPSAPCP